MKKEEVLTLITEIGTCNDDAERRTKLSTLTDEVNTIFTSNETLTASNETFKTENQSLKDANMQLFLKVTGGNQTSILGKENSEPEPEKLKYEDLFNENGGLK